MNELPTELVGDLLSAWRNGVILPVVCASAEWAFQQQSLLENDDVAEGVVALMLEQAVRDGTLVREGPAARWGISCAARDLVDERFRSVAGQHATEDAVHAAPRPTLSPTEFRDACRTLFAREDA